MHPQFFILLKEKLKVPMTVSSYLLQETRHLLSYDSTKWIKTICEVTEAVTILYFIIRKIKIIKRIKVHTLLEFIVKPL